jgi:hypothetical protein
VATLTAYAESGDGYALLGSGQVSLDGDYDLTTDIDGLT